MIDINIENFKDFKGMKKKLFQIFKGITSQLDTNTEALETINNSTETSELKTRITEIENNFIDRRVAFPLGTTNTVSLYAVANDVIQNVGDNSTLVVDFLDELQVSPYVTTDVQNQFFTVQSDGMYYIRAQVALNPVSDDFQEMRCRIEINGSIITESSALVDDIDATRIRFAIPSILTRRLSVGDVISIEIYQNNSNNTNRNINITNSFSNVNITFLGNFS